MVWSVGDWHYTLPIPSAGFPFMALYDQKQLHTVRYNKDDYREFPPPGETWQFKDLDVSRSSFSTAVHSAWITQVDETKGEEGKGAVKVWRTSESLWAAIEEYCDVG